MLNIHSHISHVTLNDHINGKQKDHKSHTASCQLLLPALESVLDHNAESGIPMDSSALSAHTYSMAGRELGRNWTSQIQKQHPKIIRVKSAKLDPKCMKNFNKTIDNKFFGKWQAINNKYGGVSPEYIWNMDEKGIQFGGG